MNIVAIFGINVLMSLVSYAIFPSSMCGRVCGSWNGTARSPR
jgi:hypothetical protein